jgi:hypothetical protein
MVTILSLCEKIVVVCFWYDPLVVLNVIRHVDWLFKCSQTPWIKKLLFNKSSGDRFGNVHCYQVHAILMAPSISSEVVKNLEMCIVLLSITPSISEYFRVLLTANPVKGCFKHFKWWALPSILESHHQYQRSTSKTMERVRIHQKQRRSKNNCVFINATKSSLKSSGDEFGNVHCINCQPWHCHLAGQINSEYC